MTHLRDAAIIATMLAGVVIGASSAPGEPRFAAGEAVFSQMRQRCPRALRNAGQSPGRPC